MNLSYSSLSTMKDCHRCFYLDRKHKLGRPQGIKSGVPTAVDLILKESLEVYRGDLPPVLKAEERLSGFQLYQGADLKKMRHWASNPLNIDLGGGNTVIGAFDDLLYNPSTCEYAYLDYKTTGKEPAAEFGEKYYQSQCDIYSDFLTRGGRRVALFGVLLFFWPEKDATGGVIFKSKALFLTPNPWNAEVLFANALQLLSGPLPPAGPVCEYCQFVEKRKNL